MKTFEAGKWYNSDTWVDEMYFDGNHLFLFDCDIPFTFDSFDVSDLNSGSIWEVEWFDGTKPAIYANNFLFGGSHVSL